MLGPLCQLKHGQIFFIYIYKFNILYLLFKYLIYLLKQDLAEYLRIVVNLKFIEWTEWPLRFHQFSSVTQWCPTLCSLMDCSTPGFPVHHQLLELNTNSCPSSQWYHPTISTSVVPFSSCLQSFPASGSFPMSQFFASGGQNIGVSASTSVLLVDIQDWFLLGWTGWIFLQSKGLSKVFSNTTVQKHQFFGSQLSLWSNSHVHTWLLEKP